MVHIVFTCFAVWFAIIFIFVCNVIPECFLVATIIARSLNPKLYKATYCHFILYTRKDY